MSKQTFLGLYMPVMAYPQRSLAVQDFLFRLSPAGHLELQAVKQLALALSGRR